MRARSSAFSSRSWLTGFKQVVQRSGFEGADGVLVVGGDDDDDRQGAFRQLADHVETAQNGHFQIQEDQIGPVLGDLAQGVGAVGGLTHDFHVRKRAQFFAQHLARHRFIVHDQGANYCKRCAHAAILQHPCMRVKWRIRSWAFPARSRPMSVRRCEFAGRSGAFFRY